MATPTKNDLEWAIAGYEAIAKRDFPAMISLAAPDCVLETRLGTYSGHEELRKYFEESIPNNMTSEVEAFVVTDARIVSLSIVTLIGPHSQIPASEKVAEVCTIEDGLVQRIEVMGRDECLETFGLHQCVADIDTLRKAYECFNRSDFDAALEHTHPDIVWNSAAVSIGGETRHGKAAVRQLLEPEVFDSQQAELEHVVARGDRVLATVVFTARGAGSGIELSNRGHQVWTMRDGKASHLDFFPEREDALSFIFDESGSS